MADQPRKENKITPNGKKALALLKTLTLAKLNFGRQKNKIIAMTAKKKRFVKTSIEATNFIPLKMKKDEISQKIKVN